MSARSTIPDDNRKKPTVTPIICKVAERMGAKVIIEPEYGFVGHIVFPNGKTTFFRDTSFSINPLGSVEIAKDKGYAAFFLREFGYPVPEGRTFFSDKLCRHVVPARDIDDGFAYVQQLGYPVVVKPDKRSKGIMVNTVHTKKDYYRSAREILRTENVMLVQRYYPGNDFRIVVLDDQVISAYQRLPLAVIGDGQLTIEELLHTKQEEFRTIGRDTIIDTDDIRIRRNLRRRGLSLSSILPAGQKVQLLDNANLSTGGDAKDMTAAIHGEWSSLAVEITERMGLRLCGVDIITESIASPPSDYIVLEINGAPGLDNYGSMGETQAEVVEGLYERVLLALAR